MLNCKIYTLEDTYDYTEADTLELNNNKYVLLSQVDDPNNICIRKVVFEDGQNYFYRLQNFEFEDVINQFALKNMNLFE